MSKEANYGGRPALVALHWLPGLGIIGTMVLGFVTLAPTREAEPTKFRCCGCT
jgi:hypothetical protein